MTVKSILFILFNLLFLNLYCQENISALKNCQKINIKKFIELKKANPKIKTTSIFENGKVISQKDRDSIANSPKKRKYSQIFYRDTINNKIYIVKKELTEKEVQERKKASERKLDEDKTLRKELNGSVLKELDLIDINGGKHNLNSLKGKVIVLNFWFIQCKPCVAEFPELNDLKKKFKSKPVDFFAISWNDKKSLDQFFETHKLDFTVIPNGRHINEKFKIPYFPFHIIIDQNGKTEYIKNFKKINSKINKLL